MYFGHNPMYNNFHNPIFLKNKYFIFIKITESSITIIIPCSVL